MKHITFLTTARSDFGLLKNLILEMNKIKKFKVSLIATGSHFSKEYGNTFKEILESKIRISKKIKIIKNKTLTDLSIPISSCIVQSSKFFKKHKINLLIILGDRFEAMAIALSAHINQIPIGHIHGGELTMNLMDDAFRHSITKLSQLHFTANKIYKNRVVQLGENPKNVFLVGGLGVDSINRTIFLSKKQLEQNLKIDLTKRKNILVTVHPETLEKRFDIKNIKVLINAIEYFKDDVNFIFTSPGNELKSGIIQQEILRYVKKRSNCKYFSSLGSQNYYSLLKYTDAMLGNSSSGILEMPYFDKPTINIGNRQSGRLMDKTIINVSWRKKEIIKAIKKSLVKQIKGEKLFGNGGSSKRIIEILSNINLDKLMIKKFYDLK